MFAATYIINLARSHARWETLQPVLEQMGAANPLRFEAVDGAALDSAALAHLQASGALAATTAGFDPHCAAAEIGCALSHAAVLREIVARDWPTALILEDDIALAPPARNWQRRLGKTLADLPASWELLYLYRCFDIRHRCRRLTRRVLVPWTPQGGAAYAVTRSGARKLLAALTPVPSAVDRVYSSLVQRREIEAYAASPLLIHPGAHASIIRNGHPTKLWMENGVNLPPEYWPEPFLAHLGEQAPSRWRRALHFFQRSRA